MKKFKGILNNLNEEPKLFEGKTSLSLGALKSFEKSLLKREPPTHYIYGGETVKIGSKRHKEIMKNLSPLDKNVS